MDSHLSVDDIAGLVDGDLPEDRRTAAEAHLVGCAECRAELVSACELADTAPARSQPRARWLAVAAAALVVFAVSPLARIRTTNTSRNAQRAPVSAGASVQTRSPMNGTTVYADSLRFAWRAVPAAMTYHVIVTDSVGTPVYSRSTADTVIGPITDAHLTAGSRYFWYVDALTDDGSSVSSPQSGFFTRMR